jgi:hypothetical protein
MPYVPHLPPSPDLDKLRHIARDLLRAYKADDAAAKQRIRAQVPRLVDPMAREIRLADALFAIAREQGFASWPKLKASVEALARERAMNAARAETNVASSEPGSKRKVMCRAKADQIVDLAQQSQTEQLAEAVSVMPLWMILGVREFLVESGNLPRVVEVLLTGLRHWNPKIRYFCALALDHYADDRCVEPLRQLLADPVPRVRRIALHSLSCDKCKLRPLQRTDDIVAQLIELARNDPSINVRRDASYKLTEYCSDRRARLALELLLARETDPRIQRHARLVASWPKEKRHGDHST